MSCDNEQFDLFPTNAREADAAAPQAAQSAAAAPQVRTRTVKTKPAKALKQQAPIAAHAVQHPMTDTAKRFLSVGEVAQRYSVSVPTIWRWQKLGTFPHCYAIGSGTSRWAVADLEDYDRRLKVGGVR